VPLPWPGTLTDWEYLLSGVISARESGDYTTSVELSKEALKFDEEEFGKEDKYYFLSLSQLGTSHQMSGAIEEAEAIFNRALKEKERLFGVDHPSVAASLFQLGQVELKKGRRQVAEQLFMRANAISMTHPESNNTIDSLAFNLRDRDRTLQLEERYLYELQAYELELGDDHPELLMVLNNLGLLYQFQGRYDEAIELFQRIKTLRSFRQLDPSIVRVEITLLI
jgi:tetratricopeptide (TPR) repeat protein